MFKSEQVLTTVNQNQDRQDKLLVMWGNSISSLLTEVCANKVVQKDDENFSNNPLS